MNKHHDNRGWNTNHHADDNHFGIKECVNRINNFVYDGFHAAIVLLGYAAVN